MGGVGTEIAPSTLPSTASPHEPSTPTPTRLPTNAYPPAGDSSMWETVVPLGGGWKSAGSTDTVDSCSSVLPAKGKWQAHGRTAL